MSKIFKKSKFRVAQIVKMAVFGASKWPKLDSRKVWVAAKSWNLRSGTSLELKGWVVGSRFVYKL